MPVKAYSTVLVLVATTLVGSFAQGGLAFEVASLKPAGPVDQAHEFLAQYIASSHLAGFIPGDDQRIEIRGWSAAELVASAYKIPIRQIDGPPWASNTRYDIEALIPSGQSRDKAPEMLRTLLQERLALKAHSEVRNLSGYVITVGKNGQKLEETGPAAPSNDPRGSRKQMRPGYVGQQIGHASMVQLADILTRELKAPVEDQTGLKGYYAILIEIPAVEAEDELARPGLYREALNSYGLRLSAGKIDVPVVVIDNLSKTPREN